MRTLVLCVAIASGAIASGCIHSDLVACDDGTLCPVGLVCDAVHHGCTTPEQVAACNGKLDLAECKTAQIAVGICHDGVCFTPECGNQLIDPGETCDDGNASAGDGCAADCRSTERCGNGVVDAIVAEQCDDGNLRDRDGCSSSCRPEALAWRRWVQTGPTRNPVASAYDTVRRRLVVFNGMDPSVTTLEWDGTTWLDVSPPLVAPPPRDTNAIAYDEDHHVVVLFGGVDFEQLYGDTWTWDGEHWTDVTPSASPGARMDAAMAYDATRHRIVMYGGVTGAGIPVAETWEWDGASWTQRTPAVSPPALQGAAMAHDPVRGVTVMATGSTISGAAGGTWLWDGTTWVAGPTGPTPRTYAMMTYDPSRGCVVIAGAAADTWCWTGQIWTMISTTTPPSLYPQVFFDRARGKTMLAVPLIGMWQLAANGTWANVTPDLGPTQLIGPAMAYDERRGRLVLFGGQDAGGTRADTWESTGNGWFLRKVVGTSPAARIDAQMTYDARRGTIVMWGGGTTDAAVWEWDGTTWSSHLPAAHPDPASRPAFAYDGAIGKTVLFGATNATYINATLTWDGVAWVDVSGPTRPPSRIAPAMAYDARHGELVMFGGLGPYNDTWVWTLAQGWVERMTASAPSQRWGQAMTYDAARGEVLLFGGLTLANIHGDLWSWNGATWTRRALAPAPPPSEEHQLVYDPIREQTVLFTQDSWVLQWRGDGASDLCDVAIDRDGDGLAGCGDPDCWASCTPSCPPGTTCSGGPTCGDQVIDTLETCRLCPPDVGGCAADCGDGFCDAPETVASCPGDC